MTQTSSPDLTQLLSEMSTLLDCHGDGSWAIAFRRLAHEAKTDEEQVLDDVRGMFGGMGSLSDIVLFGSDGKLLHMENDRFDQLRSELYRRTRP